MFLHVLCGVIVCVSAPEMNDSPTTSNEVTDQAASVPFNELVKMLEKSFQEVQTSAGIAQQSESKDDSKNHPTDNACQSVEDLVRRLEHTWRQRAQLSEIESELARRIEKLNGQKKSLSRKFRAEWKALNDAKQEFREQQTVAQPRLSHVSFDDRTRKLAQAKSLLVAAREETEPLDESGRSPTETAEIQSSEMFDLKRQLESALAELYELKSRNIQLQASQESSEIQTSGANWEDMKKALINDLEGGSGKTPSADASELAEAVRKSRQVIQQKDQTISQLEALIQENKSVEQEAKNTILDENEVIASEIERLNDLQKQWKEKIGQAEIELSQERARLARDRSKLDEMIEEIQEAQETAENPEAPRGRKWREHLGLD